MFHRKTTLKWPTLPGLSWVHPFAVGALVTAGNHPLHIRKTEMLVFSQLDRRWQPALPRWARKASGIWCCRPALPVSFLLGSFPASLFQACSTAWFFYDPRAGPGTGIVEPHMAGHWFSLSRSLYYALYSLTTLSNFPSLSWNVKPHTTDKMETGGNLVKKKKKIKIPVYSALSISCTFTHFSYKDRNVLPYNFNFSCSLHLFCNLTLISSPQSSAIGTSLLQIPEWMMWNIMGKKAKWDH